ncbi:MAG: hypothetical protein ACXV8O_14130 [Methylobacter sp.]
MHAFEELAATLLVRDGYWVYPSFKVELSKDEKVSIGRHSSPRWELDLIAYRPATNRLLIVECKAYLDSTGTNVGSFSSPKTDRYKLFNDEALRKVVISRLVKQLSASGLILPKPNVGLALMTAKIRKSDRDAVTSIFKKNKWELFDAEWIKHRLHDLSTGSYENNVSSIVAKMLLRDGNG